MHDSHLKQVVYTTPFNIKYHRVTIYDIMHHHVTSCIIMSQELDSQDPVHKEFWDAMMVIAEVELQEAVKQDEMDWARLRGEPLPAKYTIKEAGLHESVDSDVQMMLAGMPFLLPSKPGGHASLPLVG